MPVDRPTRSLDGVDLWVERIGGRAEARALLCELLANRVGLDPEELTLFRTGSGQPILPQSLGLSFNMAHTSGWVLIAVSEDCLVGVDLEPMSKEVRLRALGRHFLTKSEIREFHDSPAPLLAGWARKEAVLKACGVGLAVDPYLVEVGRHRVISLPPELGSAEPWELHDVEMDGYIGVVAIRRVLSAAGRNQ